MSVSERRPSAGTAVRGNDSSTAPTAVGQIGPKSRLPQPERVVQVAVRSGLPGARRSGLPERARGRRAARP